MAPPLLTITIIVEHVLRDMEPDELWIDILLNGEYANSLGPFKTSEARQKSLYNLQKDIISLAEWRG